MNRSMILLAGGALSLWAPATAFADCTTDLAAFEAEHAAAQGIAKDGSLAPLQDPAARPESAATPPGAAPSPSAKTAPTPAPKTAPSPAGPGSEAAPEGKISKDGTTAPLGADPSQAMSGQDAQAQQSGGQTASEAAKSGGPSATGAGTGAEDARQASRGRALAEAKAALLAGNEEACLNALKKAAEG